MPRRSKIAGRQLIWGRERDDKEMMMLMLTGKEPGGCRNPGGRGDPDGPAQALLQLVGIRVSLTPFYQQSRR